MGEETGYNEYNLGDSGQVNSGDKVNRGGGGVGHVDGPRDGCGRRRGARGRGDPDGTGSHMVPDS